MTETRLYEPARLSTPPEQTAGYLRSSKILIHVLATQTDITDDRQNLPLIAVERKYRIYPPPPPHISRSGSGTARIQNIKTISSEITAAGTFRKRPHLVNDRYHFFT